MYVKINKTKYRGTEYYRAFLVKSVRTPKGPRHEVVCNFGRVSSDEGERLKRSFKLVDDKESIIARRGEFRTVSSLSLGDVYAVFGQFKPLGISKIMDKAKDDALLKALVVNRCINPQSKIKVVSWYSKTVLPLLTGLATSEVDKNSIYGVLDKIEAKKEAFEDSLYKAIPHQPEGGDTNVYIDWTSSYFEGDKCEMAEYGYSKDHRPDRKQVMLSLAIKSGYPFYWKVHDGNSAEVKVFEKEAKHLKERFGLREVTFIFDRGPVSDSNLSDLEGKGIKYISALDKPQIHTTIPSGEFGFIGRLTIGEDYDFVMKQKDWKKLDDKCYFREAGVMDRRYILLWNPEIFELHRTERNEILASGEEFLKSVKESLKKPQSPSERDGLIKTIHEVLLTLKADKYFSFDIKNTSIELEYNGSINAYPAFELEYEINHETVRKQEREDGLWVIITNHHEIHSDHSFTYSAEKIILAYRGRQEIEAAFKHIKGVLKIRPIHAWKPEHVKAHYTICVLAYAINKRIDNLLPKNWMALRLYEELDSTRLNLIEVGSTNTTFAIPPRLENTYQKLLKTIGVNTEDFNKLTTCDYSKLYDVVTK